MKRIAKVFSFAVSIPVLLVSCGQVMAVPTATVTLSTEVVFTPSLVSSVIGNGPDKDLSGYRLSQISKDDVRQQVEQLDSLMFRGDIETVRFPPLYSAKLMSETLVKQNTFSSDTEGLWELVRNDPGSIILPSSIQQTDLLAFLMADMLNRNSVKQEDLADALSMKNIWMDGNQVIKNGAGPGNDVELAVLRIGGDYPEGRAIYAVWQNAGIYKVERINEWMGAVIGGGIYYVLGDAGDADENGINEFVIEVEYGHSGEPSYAEKVLELYQWVPQHSKFEFQQKIPVFAQSSDRGPAEGDWVFSGNGKLSINDYWYTAENCPHITTEHKYRWDGKLYVENSIKIVPSVPVEPMVCRFYWADVVINNTTLRWHNNEAIAVFDGLINSWPHELDQEMGSAIGDFYRLRLGLWHDLRGEDTAAMRIMRDLSKSPENPSFDLPSRLAALYLKERMTYGFAKACLSVQQAYTTEFMGLFDGNIPMDAFSVQLEKFGFSTEHLAGESELLCQDTDALPAALEINGSHDINGVPDWLIKNGFNWYQKFEVDLNNDGLVDLLMAVDTYEDNDPGIWLFLQKPDSISALLPDRFGPFKSVSVSGYVPSDFRLTLLRDPSWSYSETTSYSWDANLNSFNEIDFFHDLELTLETNIFRQRDYETAIHDLTKFLEQDLNNMESVKNCTNSCQEWYIPYFHYLLGISYELSGKNPEATRVYYELWKDYPDNVFGVAASFQLEPIMP